jgi:hypothetical protein
MNKRDTRSRRGRTLRKESAACSRCGKTFERSISELRRKRKKSGPFCTKACAALARPARPRRPLKERFWEKVGRDGPIPGHAPELGPCWLWLAGRLPTGYGQFGIGSARDMSRRGTGAHRVAWALSFGDPGESWVLHRCDNPPCVNPEHLFLGTAQDNTDDCVSKGRLHPGPGFPAGVDHHRAKLTDDIVRHIRARITAGEVQKHVALELGIPSVTVNHIVRRRTWRHI